MTNMGKKKVSALPEPVSGGEYETLYKLLIEERDIEARLDEINQAKTGIAMMLCTEANMTEATGKTLRFAITGTQDVVKVNRMDRLTITDKGVELALANAETKYKASIKPFKAEYEAYKKMIEVKAANEGRATKLPSYYASIDKPKSNAEQLDENTTTNEA